MTEIIKLTIEDAAALDAYCKKENTTPSEIIAKRVRELAAQETQTTKKTFQHSAN